MSTNKYILLLFSLLLMSVFAQAQRIYQAPSKKEAEQIGKNIYVISTGDTTKVVNRINSGLTDEYSQFLFRKSHIPGVDSVFMETEANYNSLEEAVFDIDLLLREVEMEKRINNERNEALGFRLSRDYRNLRKKEQTAMTVADSLLRRDASIEQLTKEYIGYKGKPTYYINGVEVPHSLTAQLYPQDVIKREMKVTGTTSGNPFGEVWYLVSEKALERLKIPTSLTTDYLYNSYNTASVPSVSNSARANIAPIVEKKAPKAPDPVVRREITSDGKKIDRVVAPIETDASVSDVGKEVRSESTTTTRVISRTINDEKVGTDSNSNYIFNRPGIKPVQNPTQSSIRQQHYNSGTPHTQELKAEPEVKSSQDEDAPKTAPKKSVRRIKEKIENQYKDED